MRTVIIAFLSAAAVIAVPQAVTSAIAPAASPPSGCYENYDGSFLIGPVNATNHKRDLESRNTQLGISLKNGVLTDPQGRTGYVASNYQFQFDGPPQAGAIWTAGFSVCTNNRLVLGNDETWWKCLDGSFYNLYFKSIGEQCIEIYLIVRPEPGSGGVVTSSSASTAGQSSGSQQSGTSASTTPGTTGNPGTTAPSSPSTTGGTALSGASTTPPKMRNQKGGLAPAVKIGIGVGVGVGVGGIQLGVVIFFCLRRRLDAKTTPTETQNLAEKREIQEVPIQERYHELAAGRGQLPELRVKERPQELPTDR